MSVLLLLIGDTVSLCNPGWPRTCYIDQTAVDFRDQCASASQVLGLKENSTLPCLAIKFLSLSIVFISSRISSFIVLKFLSKVSLNYKCTCSWTGSLHRVKMTVLKIYLRDKKMDHINCLWICLLGSDNIFLLVYILIFFWLT